MSAAKRYCARRNIRLKGRIVELLFVEPTGDDRKRAMKLIERTHYQPGSPRGRLITVNFADPESANSIREAAGLSASTGSSLAGAAVVGPGCVRGKPSGRKYLAKHHFPDLNLAKMTRDETVRGMGLAMIQRVAVDPVYRGIGIGQALALECRRFATYLCPPARFVEVMTTRRLHAAEALLHDGAESGDFLKAAGFVLAPIYTGRKWRQTSRGSGAQALTVRLYYWAPSIRTNEK